MPVRIGPEVQALPRRLIWGALAAVALVGLALAGRGGIADPPPVPVDVDERQEPLPSPSPGAGGGWAELGEAPVAAPGRHRGAWTGDRLVVADGAGDLAAYDPETRRWRQAPPGPVDLGHDPELTWTGEEVLVWGGHILYGERGPAIVAYDPAQDRWRRGRDRPGRLLSFTVHVWTGERLLVWDRIGGLSYDPAADTWDEIDRIPAGWADAQALWTGDGVLVWGRRTDGDAPFAAAYDPAAGSWEQALRPWLHEPERAAALWTGQEALLWGRPRLIDGVDGPPVGLAYRPETDNWRWLPDAPVDLPADQVDGLQGDWAGDRAIFYGSAPGRQVGLVYDGAWSHLPRGGGARHNPVLAWTGTELLVWGGYTPQGPAVDLVAWRPTD